MSKLEYCTLNLFFSHNSNIIDSHINVNWIRSLLKYVNELALYNYKQYFQ